MNEEEQQQQQINPFGFNPMIQTPMPELPNQDFFKFRIDNADILLDLEHHLKGEVLITTPDGKQKYEKKYEPLANEDGISLIISTIYACGINKNVLLGCLTHDEIYIRCKQLWIEMAKIFAIGYRRYGIRRDLRGKLIKIVVWQVHSGLSRSESGKEATQLSTATQRVEHTLTENKPQQSSVFNPFGAFQKK